MPGMWLSIKHYQCYTLIVGKLAHDRKDKPKTVTLQSETSLRVPHRQRGEAAVRSGVRERGT